MQTYTHRAGLDPETRPCTPVVWGICANHLAIVHPNAMQCVLIPRITLLSLPEDRGLSCVHVQHYMSLSGQSFEKL